MQKPSKENKLKIIRIIITSIGLICVFLMTFSLILVKKVTNLDEIWNYNTARVISNGLLPYKQVSMITTPLLSLIIAVVLKITTNELIVYRILNAIFATVIVYIAYKIFVCNLKRDDNKKTYAISMALSGLILFLYKDFFKLDYNFFVLLIALIIEYIELKNVENCDVRTIEKTKGQNWEIKKIRGFLLLNKNAKVINTAIGMLAGLAICAKQTIGCFIAIEIIITPLIMITKKKEIKNKYLKTILFRIIGIMIPTLIFVTFLTLTGSIDEFIGYAINGIKTFSNSIPYSELLKNTKTSIVVLSKIMPILIIMIFLGSTTYAIHGCIIKKNININGRKFLIMTVCSLPMLITMYPISDDIHFMIGNLPALIEILFLGATFLIKIYNKIRIKPKKYIALSLKTFVILTLIFKMVNVTYKNIIQYVKNENKSTTIEHYKYLIIDNYIIERINDLTAYRKQKAKEGINVYILDAEAAVYDIPQNIYYKNYDMFLKGNIGANGEDGIISDIEKSNNCIYLIRKEGLPYNWQTPTKVIEYIRQNLKKQETVSIFDAYYKGE